MILRSWLGDLRRQLLCSIHSRTIPLNNPEPIVSFCFDDFPRTAYTTGGSILGKFGARGTYYAALGLMNTCNDLGDQFSQGDIESLLSDGHELGCHTFSHSSCRSSSLKTFEADVLRGRDAIQEMTGREATNFAYPYGHVTARLKKKIGMQMKSCRGIYGGINSSQADLNLLRANSLYGDINRLPEADALLSFCRRQGSWLIFYTHDVRQNPSPFGCTPALLERCAALALEKGFKLVTVEKTLDATYGVID
jgi:peptidoglycan/xylan/chitin deacetylase (PgdA/CDA1 family)